MLSTIEAKEILGKNFVHVGSEDSSSLATSNIPWSEETLTAHADTHMLVYFKGMSLKQMSSDNSFAHFFADRWFENEAFARQAPDAGWHLICKTPRSDSGGKWWSEQVILLNKTEVVPGIAVLTYAVLMYYLQNNERLFGKDYVRTSDITGPGSRISLNCFDRSGLHVDKWNEDHYAHIRIATELKPEANWP